MPPAAAKPVKRRRASDVPPGGDPDEPHQESSILADAAYFCVVGLLFAIAMSRMITGTWMFGYENSRWAKLRTYMPQPNITLTPDELLQHNGSDPSKPLYLAVDGEVFDVSENRRVYGPGGSYHIFAGKDCARAYATGCFRQDCTYDLRGLDEKQLKAIEGWQSFYNKSDKYFRVGTLLNPPIDPESPEPPPCKK